MRITRVLLVLTGAAFLAAGLLGVLSASVRQRPVIPRGVRHNISTRQLDQLKQEAVERNLPGPEPLAQAQVVETNHDFGVMDTRTARDHTFAIYSVGRTPLKLGSPATTCECSRATLSQRQVPPGGQATLTIAWNPGEKEGPFGVAVSVPTNDPEQPRIEFRVSGQVQTRLQAAPPTLTFSHLLPGESATQSTLLFSQVWNSFQIEEVSSSLDGLSWDIRPADGEALQRHAANHGYVLSVTTPENLPKGYFQEWLKLEISTPDQLAEPVTCQIPVAGRVHGRIGIYGPGIDPTGNIELGVTRLGQPLRKRFVLRVRDQQPDLQLRKIEVSPEFLQVRVSPYLGAAGREGTYHLNVEIPPDAPACSHLAVRHGQLRIITDHPRIPDTTLKVSFAVVAPD